MRSVHTATAVQIGPHGRPHGPSSRLAAAYGKPKTTRCHADRVSRGADRQRTVAIRTE